MSHQLGLAIFLFLVITKVTAEVIEVQPTNFDPQACIQEGTVITLQCAVEDPNGRGGTIWSGSPSIFDCPDVNTLTNNILVLRHSQSVGAQAYCGDLVSATLIEENGTLYISNLTIKTTIEMDGGSILCSSIHGQFQQEVQLKVEGILQSPRFELDFPSSARFQLTWEKQNNTVREVNYINSEYTCDELAGDCVFHNEILSCSGWEPNGQTCNVSVTAAISNCDFQSLTTSHVIYLSAPRPPPVIKTILPLYSQEGKLHSIRVTFLADGQFDDNGLEITYQVTAANNEQPNIEYDSQQLMCDNDETCERIVTLRLDTDQQEVNVRISAFATTDIGTASTSKIFLVARFQHYTDIYFLTVYILLGVSVAMLLIISMAFLACTACLQHAKCAKNPNKKKSDEYAKAEAAAVNLNHSHTQELSGFNNKL